MLEQNEARFRRVMNRIGIAMLIFLVLSGVLEFVRQGIAEEITKQCEEITENVINTLMSAIVYLLSFMVPAFLLKALLGKDHRPMMLKKTVTWNVWAYITVGISLVLVFAHLNAKFVSVFNYSEFSSEVLWGTEPMDNYEVVLAFITTAMVPAFCEEFLFRGAILSALRPYGKGPAVVISAVLFGLMHQNAEQVLYATAAGLVLGFVVYETGSMWCGILLHFFNNFISVIETVIVDRVEMTYAVIFVNALELLIFIAGVFGLIVVLKNHAKKSKQPCAADIGVYKRDLSELEDDSRVVYKLTPGAVAKNFFAPAIIAFIVLCTLTMLGMILLSILYNKGLYV